MCKALRSEVCSRRNNKILPHTPIRKACRPAPAIPSGRTCGAALHRRAALCADYGAGMVRGCGHPPRWNSSGDAVAGKTTVFRCKKAMIFVRKSRVFDRFLHEIARFSRVFGVLFLPVRTYRTGRRPGHLLSPALLPPGVRSVRRPVFECMANKSEYPTRSRAGRPGCYPQRPGSRSTAQRKPGRPGAVRLNDQSRPTTQREARAVPPILSGVGSLGFWGIGGI